MIQSNNPLKKGDLTENSIGTVTRDIVHTRAGGLAVIAGRSPNGATMSDLAQARRELTGEEIMDGVRIVHRRLRDPEL